ncbi:hypothetical protein PRVXH_000780 [Proteinivorax hydrogeniformans]|uniref:ATLF-like domain-containing protein n=1 Tax=Proteinivorax hydrogeniformans TaxID=1826727 RepID=A0AAU8HVQ6_9FIRM
MIKKLLPRGSNILSNKFLLVALIFLLLLSLLFVFINIRLGQNLYHPNGELKYQGQLKGGAPHSEGVVFNQKGEKIIEGEFHEGYLDGFGLLQDKNLTYKGHWEKNHFSGQGNLYIKENVVYQGQWELGLPHGQGELFTLDGDKIFEGNWLYGVPTEGSFLRPDGSYFSCNANEALLSQAGRRWIEQTLSTNELDHKKLFLNMIELTEKKVSNALILEPFIVQAEVDNDLKSLFYQFLQLDKNLSDKHESTLLQALEEIERIPTALLKELTRLGVNLRFVTGSISDQPEFYENMSLDSGVVSSHLSGIASPNYRLAVVRLDVDNATCVTFHEIGHLVDYFLLEDISNTEKFEDICSQEATKLFNCCSCDLSYYTDNCSEYFAESFAAFFLSRESKRKYMPNCSVEFEEIAPQTSNFFEVNVAKLSSKGYHYSPKLAAYLDEESGNIQFINENMCHDNINLYTLCTDLDWVLQLDWPYNQIADVAKARGVSAPLSEPIDENTIYMVANDKGKCYISKQVTDHPPKIECDLAKDVFPITQTNFFKRVISYFKSNISR